MPARREAVEVATTGGSFLVDVVDTEAYHDHDRDDVGAAQAALSWVRELVRADELVVLVGSGASLARIVPMHVVGYRYHYAAAVVAC